VVRNTLLGLYLLLSFCQSGAAGQGRIAHEFPNSWTANKGVVDAAGGPEGAPAVRLEPLSATPRPSIALTLRDFPKDRRIRLTLWLRGGEEGQWVSIDTKASRMIHGKEAPAQIRVNPADGFVTTEYARVSTTWKPFIKSLVISRSATSFSVKITNLARQPLAVAKPTFQVGDAEMCDLDGPGVLRGQIKVWVNPVKGHDTGMVSFPIPLKYGDQVPLAMRLTSEPQGAIKSFAFARRTDGVNWLCNVLVDASAGPTAITWQALVYVRGSEPRILAKAQTPAAPPQAAGWLRPSVCVQANAEEIRRHVQNLIRDDPDLETYARRVAQFTCDNRGGSQPWNRLDALAALSCAGGGSCTNRANLAAALLRARGVPARTVAHLPTWNLGQPLFTHWLVEYWHPGNGWIALESTWGEFQPPPHTAIILAVSSVEDENLADEPIQTRWVLPGAPMWAVARIGSTLLPSPDKNQQANWAKPERRLEGSPKELESLFAQASAIFDNALISRRFANPSRFEQIERALRTGRAGDLYMALK
jgi:hypothetical protein